ncbi:S66 peptidase family protein [Tenacibaculum sp. M341]|uniref:S66 peptidase family protein n=1 Tax=Tenacibaculum sp. M341 TaxID=2530339 RepID=UPI001043CB10|nr:LD-carboxypeptidase [Tenacibaculum sp. M341]TCI93508.1 LD-carboxypeptidase [Tenacibaculum sp. M341]
MKLKTPSYLKKGDTVAIVAPAGILLNRNEVIEKAKNLLESWDLKVVLGKNLFQKGNHFAGSDEQRTNDFQEALNNPKVKAIWCARGGYGSVRIIDLLNFTEFKKNPKWIIGYSDVTVFHNHIHNLGVETLHAMMGTSLQDDIHDIPHTIETFKKVLFGEQLSYSIASSSYNREGNVTGQLVGGNLAILTAMLGSESQISTDHKILFIEEIGEYEYAIDRMLQSLYRANYFKNVKGIIIGDISKVKENSTNWGCAIEELFLNALPKEIPVLFNFPAGHEPDNRALIMGRNIELSINKDQFSKINFYE